MNNHKRIAELEATRVSDEDIEDYIEYLRADAEQYGQWGNVGRRDGYNKEADRMQAILTLRKGDTDATSGNAEKRIND
jgi:hypothetical protein